MQTNGSVLVRVIRVELFDWRETLAEMHGSGLERREHLVAHLELQLLR